MVGNVDCGHIVVAFDFDPTHLHLLALADNEGHHVLVVVDRGLAVAHFGQQEPFGMVVLNHRLAVTFQLALAVNLARYKAQLEA